MLACAVGRMISLLTRIAILAHARHTHLPLPYRTSGAGAAKGRLQRNAVRALEIGPGGSVRRTPPRAGTAPPHGAAALQPPHLGLKAQRRPLHRVRPSRGGHQGQHGVRDPIAEHLSYYSCLTSARQALRCAAHQEYEQLRNRRHMRGTLQYSSTPAWAERTVGRVLSYRSSARGRPRESGRYFELTSRFSEDDYW